MKSLFLATLALALPLSAALGGEIYGTLKEGGKAVREGTKVEVRCPKGGYAAATDRSGAYRLFVPEEGKCTLTVRSGDASPSMTVYSFADSARYNLVLERKDGKLTLRSE